jgi:hypothetical protein
VREILTRLTEAEHDVDTSDEEVAVIPDLSLLLSRETSREVELDSTDGLPCIFTTLSLPPVVISTEC